MYDYSFISNPWLAWFMTFAWSSQAHVQTSLSANIVTNLFIISLGPGLFIKTTTSKLRIQWYPKAYQTDNWNDITEALKFLIFGFNIVLVGLISNATDKNPKTVLCCRENPVCIHRGILCIWTNVLHSLIWSAVKVTNILKHFFCDLVTSCLSLT